jgi:site-specific DNA-methyltransferase (adenine-specific)
MIYNGDCLEIMKTIEDHSVDMVLCEPVELLEMLIKSFTNEGDFVLDNCIGSGSTGVACKNLNREFIGIEKEEKYFNIAKERIEHKDELDNFIE